MAPSDTHHVAAVVAAQDTGHGTAHDYEKGSPHLRHRSLRTMLEARLRGLVAGRRASTGGCDVLEVGGGHGTFTRCLLDAGAHVTVTETSAASAARLRSELGSTGRVEILHDTTGEDVLATDRQWDLAVMTAVLHHIPDYLSFLDRLVPLVAPGGSLFTAADPLHYPDMPARDHWADRGAYLAWRLFQGDYARGLATRVRRVRGIHDDTEPSDLVEYHVVRDGVDETAVARLLDDHFGEVEVFRYWASQAPLFQRLGGATSMRTDFGVVATGRLPTRD